jgi:signal transduction histidine kinase
VTARDPTDPRYVELAARILPRFQREAHLIAAAIVLSCATSWSRLATALALHLVLLPANTAITAFASPRFGARAEIARTVMNVGLCSIGYALIDWPLPVWFWLPYIAVAFDQLGGKHTRNMIILQCALQDASALIAGQRWLEPAAFTLLAAVCWRATVARNRIIHDMLARAEEQRDEIERSHLGLKAEVAARERVELELRHAQKLEAIGRLAAGVAHEINTPIQFVSDSIEFVRENIGDLIGRGGGPSPAPDSDEAYLTEHVPKALALASDGCQRVATIVRSMKQLAHPGSDEVSSVDLNAAITAALEVSRHEYKLVADVETRLAMLPPAPCIGGEINQVLLNLITNAAHAIEDRYRGTERRGQITVASSIDARGISISIGDDGVGIPPEIRDRIFDPFFTTKAVGRGTGQGLAIARSILERHGGELVFTTELGRGTTFTIRLPAEATLAAA